jgi:hypothetical protein
VRSPDPLGESSWSRHSQEEWFRRSGDDRLPPWLRVAALAYASHGNNGHANFKREDAAIALGKPGQPWTRQRLHEHIQLAIEYGWLAPGSTSMCLVVPTGVIDKGPRGEPKKPCRVHTRRKQASGKRAASADALLKASCPERDALEQVSASPAQLPDALRSAPISYPHLTEVCGESA